MNPEDEIRQLKFRLNSVEAYLKAILEGEASILAALGRADDPDRPTKDQWLERLRQVYQDHKNNPS